MKSIFTPTALRRTVICLTCACLTPLLCAQKRAENLVRNPGFEAIAPGKKVGLNNPIETAAGWSAPTRRKSLLYTTYREFIYDPDGSLWPFKARTGKNVAGMNVYGDDNGVPRREYIQGALTKPLTVGRKYFFEFWVHYHCEGANNIGIVFLPESIRDTTAGLLRFQPVSFQKKVTLYDNEENTWTLVRDSFVAARPFQFFVIGNFFPDSMTLIENNRYDHHFAYIDDIFVFEAPHQSAAPATITQAEEQKWHENTETSKGMQTTAAGSGPNKSLVYFKLDSSEITPESATILDSIAAELAPKQGLKIELKGFASSEGSMPYNKRLSIRRNQSVRRYLIEKGVSSLGISMKAFGEDNPVSPNDTEENRSKNRRVEIVW